MFNDVLLEAISKLPRATEIESVASLLLQTIGIAVTKSILILDPHWFGRSRYFLVAVGKKDADSAIKTSFYLESVANKNYLDSNNSLLDLCQQNLQPAIVGGEGESQTLEFQPFYSDGETASYFPLMDGEQFIGILYLENWQSDYLADGENKQLWNCLLNQAAIAFTNARKYETLLARIKQLESEQNVEQTTEAEIQHSLLLSKTIEKINSSTDPQTIFKTAVEQIGVLFEVSRCQLHTQVESSDKDAASSQIPTCAIYQQRDNSVKTYYLETEGSFATGWHREIGLSQDRAVAIDNVRDSSLLGSAIPLWKHLKIKSVLAVRTSDRGKVNGLLVLHQCDRYRSWTKREIQTIETLAAQVGMAISRANLLEQNKQPSQEAKRDRYSPKIVPSQERVSFNSQQSYRAIFEQIEIGIIERNYQTGQFIRVNNKFCDIVGYSREEVMSLKIESITHPEDIPKSSHLVAQLKKGEIEKFSFEKRYIHKNGSVVWAKVTVCPIRNPVGEVVSSLAAIEDITAIKLDRERLKQQSTAMEAAIDGIAILEKGCFIYLNSAYAKIYGYHSSTELIGKSWQVLYLPEQVDSLTQKAFPLFTKQGYWQGESEAIKKNGDVFQEELSLIQLDKEQMVCVCRDISDRKKQEKQLKQSQQRYRNLTSAAPVGIFHTDIEGNFSYVNQRWSDISGLTSETSLGTGWQSAIHLLDRQRVLQQWQEAVNNHLSFRAEYRFCDLEDIEIWVFAQAIPEYDLEGKLIGYIGTITDISQLKESQKYLTRQLQREQLLGHITQEIRRNWDVSAIFDTAAMQIGKMFGVSRCLIHSYVHQPEPTIPMMAEYLENPGVKSFDASIAIGNNPHAQKVISQDLAVVSSDVGVDSLLQEAQAICFDYDIKSMLAVRTSYQGEPNGVIGVHQCDRVREWTIDEVELLEAVASSVGIALAQAKMLEKEQHQRQELSLNNLALTKAKQEAEVANQAKSHFLANMSHELRTPLNAILGFGQIMAQSDSLTSQHREHLTIINRCGKHLLTLINNILDLSKIEAGKAVLQKDRIDLRDLLVSLEKMFLIEAQSKGIQLNLDICDNVPQFVYTDGVKLKQISINLLSNAIKFTRQGEVCLQVKAKDLNSLVFKVVDTGAGIGKDELERIFEPFEQSDTGLKSGEGTGLGLSICRSLIGLLGGMLEVESRVGEGTTFLFEIPVQAAVESNPPLYQRRAIAISRGHSPKQILVVDDNIDNCQLLQDLLTGVGFGVVRAINGVEAVELFNCHEIDLILMDIYMPEMNGIDAAKAILAKEPEAKIIATTASMVVAEKAKMLALGCKDVINKPFVSEQLLEAVAKQLEINYIYSDRWNLAGDSSESLGLEALEAMPVTWLERLHLAVVSANEQDIYEAIELIPTEYASLAETLTEMVANFAVEGIINRTEELLELS